MILNVASVIILFLFIGGICTYFYALIEEGRVKAPFYTVLATFAAALTIAATFTAVIAEWLGVLG